MVSRAFYSAMLLTCALTVSQAALALSQLQATVSQNPVGVGETVELLITADDSIDADDIDLSVLDKDFRIVGRSSGSSTSIINGKVEKQVQLRLMLLPLSSGKLIVPSFHLGNVSSKPFALDVVRDNSDSGQAAAPADISTSVSAGPYYPQQSWLYTITIKMRKEFLRANMNAPEVDDLSFEQLGKDESEMQTDNGMRVQVITRKYVVSAKQPGSYTIPGPELQYEVQIGGQTGGFFSQPRTKVYVAKANDQTLDINAIPDGLAGQWLPATLLQLDEEQQPIQANYQVGDAITRTITLTAAGVHNSVLPDLTFTAPAGIKLYPEKAERVSTTRQSEVISQLKQSVAVIATQPGRYTLPEVRVPWFNVKTKQQQWAVLPAKTIEVVAAPGQVSASVPTPTASSPQSSSNDMRSSAPSEPGNVATENQTITGLLTWPVYLFAGLWLVTLITYLLHVQWLKRRSGRIAQPVSATPQVDVVHWQQRLRHAQQQQDSQALQDAILGYCRAAYPTQPFFNLPQVAAFYNNPLLSAALAPWQQQFQPFAKLDPVVFKTDWLKLLKAPPKPAAQTVTLPNLYPL